MLAMSGVPSALALVGAGIGAWFGWWLIPAAITLAALVIAIVWRGHLGDAGRDPIARAVSAFLDLLILLAFLVVCLVSWLIWALFA
ncbi:hypothetical protein [Sinorhizobium fredii]|uniref:hypothetical protein n=1 Tax=Rhizobium fredii TaxID=380 RepID=UPI0004AD8DD6|nr:hypothetical protein [Sinorhizobium fredii]ASY68889.1 hypothetical protein SF83666_c14680 [Sinorhizobium fredii CCBAU 83666]